jgi:thioredoxin reductase (NADPH)
MSKDTNPNTEITYDVAVLGGGPAGLTAAIYTSRAALKTLCFAGNPPGGQLTETTEIENFPGFPEGIQGPQLMQNFRNQAARFGTDIANTHATKVTGDFDSGFVLESTDGHTYKARSIIIATGASAKWLGLESEQAMKGKGVSACATCDAFFFKNKEVVVVGGGDAAMEESTYLTKFASKIHVLVRGSKEDMRASKIMQQRALENEKIEFHFYTELVEVLADGSGNKAQGVRIVNNQTQEESVLPDVEGVFVAIGHHPNTDFLEGFVDLDVKGYVKVTEGTYSSKQGVFVAGDVHDYRYRQAITAAGFGCMAAIDLERFLDSQE